MCCDLRVELCRIWAVFGWEPCCVSECTQNREPLECVTLACMTCAMCLRLSLTCVMRGTTQPPSGHTASLASKSWPGWRCRGLHRHPGQLFDARKAVRPLGSWAMPCMTQVRQSLEHVAQDVRAKVAHWGGSLLCVHSLAQHDPQESRMQPKHCTARCGDHRTWHSTTSISSTRY